MNVAHSRGSPQAANHMGQSPKSTYSASQFTTILFAGVPVATCA